MGLTGYDKNCASRSGGVRSVSLVGASAVKNVTLDAATRSVCAVTLDAGQVFTQYHFREDTAQLSERLVRKAGAMLVEHELQFSLDPMDAASGKAIVGLQQASLRAGLIAVVETECGERWLVGYSENLRGERPLRLHLSEGSSGLRKADGSTRTVTLRSVDDELMKGYTGAMP